SVAISPCPCSVATCVAKLSVAATGLTGSTTGSRAAISLSFTPIARGSSLSPGSSSPPRSSWWLSGTRGTCREDHHSRRTLKGKVRGQDADRRTREGWQDEPASHDRCSANALYRSRGRRSRGQGRAGRYAATADLGTVP